MCSTRWWVIRPENMKWMGRKNEKLSNFPQKWGFFQSFAEGFVPEWNQALNHMEPERSRCALQDGVQFIQKKKRTGQKWRKNVKFPLKMTFSQFFMNGFGSKWSQVLWTMKRDRSRRAESNSRSAKSIPSSQSQEKCKFRKHWHLSIDVYTMIGWCNKPMRNFWCYVTIGWDV